MKSSTMDVITKAWLQDNAFVDDIAFLLTKNVFLHPYLIDHYLEELIKLKNNKDFCLTPQGKLDVYHVEFKLRQAEKHRRKLVKQNNSCQSGSYVV